MYVISEHIQRALAVLNSQFWLQKVEILNRRKNLHPVSTLYHTIPRIIYKSKMKTPTENTINVTKTRALLAGANAWLWGV